MSSSIDTRQKLMETATDLIWQSNYDHVGIAEICKRAGVTKGAFYHHFCSKAELFVCASDNEWESVSRDLDEAMSPRFTAIEQLGRFLSVILHKHQTEGDNAQIYGCPFFTTGAQAGCEEKIIRKSAYDLCEKGLVYIVALVRNLQAESCLEGSIDPSQTARMMQQYIQGAMMHGRIYQDIEALNSDLKEGCFQILGVKAEFRSSARLAASEAPLKQAVNA